MNTEYSIHRATVEDIPEMVALFELCLGSEGGAPTIEFWIWKHIQNPMGSSPVLIARHEGVLVGIRAFMCFEFIKGNETMKAFRPVDTATHPQHQGKGIFKNLTLQLIQDLDREGHRGFIFNTPNEQSKPGYLKMGWSIWGKPSLQVFPAFRPAKFKREQERQNLLTFDFSRVAATKSTSWTVHKNSEYFRWRYQTIPLPHYGLTTCTVGAITYRIIYRLKKTKGIREYRICDILVDNSPLGQMPVKLLWKLGAAWGGGMITFTTSKKIVIALTLNSQAPVVTYRKLRESDIKIPFEEINWSIGELELF